MSVFNRLIAHLTNIETRWQTQKFITIHSIWSFCFLLKPTFFSLPLAMKEWIDLGNKLRECAQTQRPSCIQWRKQEIHLFFSLYIRRTVCSYSWIGFVWCRCHSRTRQESQIGLSGPIYVCFIHVRVHSLRVARHCLSVECFWEKF